MATALTDLFMRRGWAGNGSRLIRSLFDRPLETPADDEDFRTLYPTDRESALIDAILWGFIRL